MRTHWWTVPVLLFVAACGAGPEPAVESATNGEGRALASEPDVAPQATDRPTPTSPLDQTELISDEVYRAATEWGTTPEVAEARLRFERDVNSVSYTHLTLPTIYSV